MVLTKKRVIKEGFIIIALLTFVTGAYYLKKLADSSKEYRDNTDLSFYYGCHNLGDSVQRIYDAGGEEYILIKYKDIPLKLKKEYIKKNNLEGKIKQID